MRNLMPALLLLFSVLETKSAESRLEPKSQDELSPAVVDASQITAAGSASETAALTETESTSARRRRRRSSSRRRRRSKRRRRNSRRRRAPRRRRSRRRSEGRRRRRTEESGRRRRRTEESGRRRRRSKEEPEEPATRRRRGKAPSWSKPKCWEPRKKDSKSNPFLRADGRAETYYVNPSYRKLLQTSIDTATGKVKDTMKKMANVPSAFWIDVKSKVYTKERAKKNGIKHNHPDISTVEGILADAAKCDPPHLVLFMVYDLPNRDCFALASNGEICCHYGKDVGRTKCEMASNGFYKEYPGDRCKAGIKEYRETYVQPFVEVVKEYNERVPIVLVIEPDSLPNMITNMKDSDPPYGGLKARGCHDESKAAYMDGLTTSITMFGKETNAALYLDAGHGGWLGWANEDSDKPSLFNALIKQMNVHQYLRGFATNVANYQPVGDKPCSKLGECKGVGDGRQSNDPCCKPDPCDLQPSWNWAHNEVNYVDVMRDRARKHMPDWDVKFIVDTGRNGNPSARKSCSNWCNPRENGIGWVPTAATGHDHIDAYYWLKTPGESDGCTEELPGGGKCPRFDEMCASDDSIGSKSGEPRAPEAGLWFDYQIKQLAEYADLGDPQLVKAYQTPAKCKADGCSNVMPPPPTPAPPTLGPGRCTGNDSRCEGKNDEASCTSASGSCSWSPR